MFGSHQNLNYYVLASQLLAMLPPKIWCEVFKQLRFSELRLFFDDPIFGLAAQDFELWHLTAMDFGTIGNEELFGWMNHALQQGNRLERLRSVRLTTFRERGKAAAQGNWAPLVFV